MKSSDLVLLRISSILWVIWGLVHILAGVMVMTTDTTAGVQAIADGVDPETLVAEYPAAAGAILNQHAWNLAWVGAVTTIGGVFIWRKNRTSIWVTGMIGGLTDLGYFLFLDLGGFVRFVPGTVMTIVSSLAIVLSFKVWITRRPNG
ncbi:MAG: hypothetical protein AAGH79_01675 [Bacteroidota bacterium]